MMRPCTLETMKPSRRRRVIPPWRCAGLMLNIEEGKSGVKTTRPTRTAANHRPRGRGDQAVHRPAFLRMPGRTHYKRVPRKDQGKPCNGSAKRAVPCEARQVPHTERRTFNQRSTQKLKDLSGGSLKAGRPWLVVCSQE